MKEPITLVSQIDDHKEVIHGLADFIRKIYLPENSIHCSNSRYFNMTLTMHGKAIVKQAKILARHDKAIKFCAWGVLASAVGNYILLKIANNQEKRIKELEEKYKYFDQDITDLHDAILMDINELGKDIDDLRNAKEEDKEE